SLGLLQAATDQRDAARRSYEQALVIQEKLVAGHPNVLPYQIDLAGTSVNLGNLVRDSGKSLDSLTWYAKAIPLLQAVRQRQPNNAIARQYLCNAHWGRARALTNLGRHAETLTDWDRTLELETGSQRDLFRLPRALTLAHLGQHTQATGEAKDLAQKQNV